MKMTVGKLRELIREAVAPEELQPGKWYVVRDPHRGTYVTHLLGLEPFKDGSFLMAKTEAGPDAKGYQRADVWAKMVEREATPEEIQKAQASWKSHGDWLAKNIDTSREGT